MYVLVSDFWYCVVGRTIYCGFFNCWKRGPRQFRIFFSRDENGSRIGNEEYFFIAVIFNFVISTLSFRTVCTETRKASCLNSYF